MPLTGDWRPRREEPTDKPLAIVDGSGAVTSARMTTKAFEKSIETGQLWVAHGRRVLPWSGGPANSLKIVREADGCYVALVDLAVDANGVPKTAVGASAAAPDSLAALESVISSRRLEMPAGSYTTHLFHAGSKKIRKKLGEEAIEVVGADSKAELINECADLIYHLMVLLAAEDVGLQQVLAELDARHG